MAGATINIDDRALLRALGFLAPLGKDMTPAMRAAGENKHKRHDDGR